MTVELQILARANWVGYRVLLVGLPEDKGELSAEGEYVRGRNLFGYGDILIIIIIACVGAFHSPLQKVQRQRETLMRNVDLAWKMLKEHCEIETTANRVYFLNVSSQGQSS